MSHYSANICFPCLHKLDACAPKPLGCPGDTDSDMQPRSLGLPKEIGKVFHPNESCRHTYRVLGAPDGHGRASLLPGGVTDSIEYDSDECIDSMNKIINSCDGNVQDNPMGWRFGGE